MFRKCGKNPPIAGNWEGLFLQYTYYIGFSFHIDQRKLIRIYSLFNPFNNSIIHVIITAKYFVVAQANIFSPTLNVHD